MIKTTTNTSIRISTSNFEKVKNYANFDANFNLSKFVDEALDNYFCDENHLKKREKTLKNELKMIKKQLKNAQKMQEIAQKKAKNMQKKELLEFKNGLSFEKISFWKNAIKAIERNPEFLKGQFNLYQNSFQSSITIEGFNLLYQQALELQKRGEL